MKTTEKLSDIKIKEDYTNLMKGFSSPRGIETTPVLQNGRFIQLSAYDERSRGSIITVSSSSIQLNK